MGDGGELMELKDGSSNLIDSANQAGSWFAGTTSGRSSMSRIGVNVAGTTSSNWSTATTSYASGIGNGTPKAANVLGGTSDAWFDLYFTDNLNTVMPDYGPKAMETALINAIDAATPSIRVDGRRGCAD